MIEIGGGNDWEAVARAGYFAGYAGLQDLSVGVSQLKFFQENREEVEDLLTFLLNEEGAASMEYDINLKFHRDVDDESSKVRKNAPKSNRLLSLSGGMDSLASYYLMDEPLSVFVDYGQGHLEREREMVRMVAPEDKLVEMYLPSPKEVANNMGNPSRAWPVDGFKIPCRNLVFFAALSSHASYGGDDIQMSIGAYEGEIMERNRDKSPRFFTAVSSLFSEYFGTPVSAGSPVGDLTKVEVADVLAGEDVDPWQIPFCDAGNRCADCKSCFNFALAIELSDVEIDDPYYQDWLGDLLESDTASYYRTNIDQYEGRRRKELEEFVFA